MATIRANCPDCGDVDLTTRDVQVHVCASTNQGSYSFRCPGCRLAVAKLAEEQIVDLLISNGVRLSVWQLPAEMSEAKGGKPICYDDLLEFHFALKREGWLDDMLADFDMGGRL
jgi:hypothetical protein